MLSVVFLYKPQFLVLLKLLYPLNTKRCQQPCQELFILKTLVKQKVKLSFKVR